MKFKDLCEEFSKTKNVTTMLVHQEEEKKRNETYVTFTWSVFLKSNGRKIPLLLVFETKFNDTFFHKNIYYRHEIPFPTLEALTFAREFEGFIKDFLEKSIEKRDTDRVKRVVSGEYVEREISHHRYFENILEEEEEKEEDLAPLVDNFTHQLLLEKPREKGYSNQVLFMYGQNGRTFGELLKEREVCEVDFVDEDTTVLTPLFPFAVNAREYKLSGTFLGKYEVMEPFKEKGVLVKRVGELEYRQFKEKEKHSK